MKKIYVLISIFIIFIVFYIIVLVMPREYKINYQIGSFNIEESFNNNLKYYLFYVEYGERVYPLVYNSKYTSKRMLITNVEEISYENTTCLSIYINEDLYPVCYKENELIDFHLTDEEILNHYQDIIYEYSDTQTDSFELLKIYNYLDHEYFIWNYRGYYYLSERQNQEIMLLENDNYNNSLGFKTNEYLITPNYDRPHSFNELFIINCRNLDLKSFLFEKEEISYNSYFQGFVGGNVYLVDRRNSIQYQINIRNRNIEVIGNENVAGQIYNNGWKEESLTRMVNEDYIFQENQVNNFKLINNSLYYVINDYKIRISDYEVKIIVSSDNNQVFYLVNHILYMYSNLTGEVKLIEYSEWEFNYLNKIFIY